MIRFSKYTWVYIILSLSVILPGLYSLARFGLRPSIDFAGGTLLEVSFEKSVDKTTITNLSEKDGIAISSIQSSGDKSYIIRTKEDETDKFSKLIEDIELEASTASDVIRQDSVGPLLGEELLKKTIVAALIAVLAILAYVAYAFKNVKFGLAAIVALLHDGLIVVGSFSIFGILLGVEVDTLFVTALLTTMSFSVHDTIVVFDRIREHQKRSPKLTFNEICDKALTETMGRSLVNSVTIIIMLLSLVLMGGETVKWFSTALLIGTIAGTYSSPFVATPSLIFFNKVIK